MKFSFKHKMVTIFGEFWLNYTARFSNKEKNKSLDKYPNCWEINKCEMEKGGRKAKKYGVCPVSELNRGHTCWVVAGSMNYGKPFCPKIKKKGKICSDCPVFQRYSDMSKSGGIDLEKYFPEEAEKYKRFFLSR